jgi:hypothetical protein
VSTTDGGAPQGRVSPVTDAPSAKASKATEQHIDLRDLATILAPKDEVRVSIIKGIVTAVALTGSPPTITVQVSGDTSVDIPGVRFIDSYSPVVGDTVMMLKQGSEFFGLGQMNDTGAGTANGWTIATLNTGFTHHGNSNGQYEFRVVVDNGDRKLQMRGSVALTNTTATAICTLPVGMRPTTKRSLLVARDVQGGSNVAQIDINTDGTVVLVGAKTAPTGGAASDPTTGTSSIGVTVNSFVLNTSTHSGHTHWLSDWLGGPPRDFTPDPGNGAHSHTVPAHGHGMAHTHEHPHTHTNTVAHPTWLSFNGVELYL